MERYARVIRLASAMSVIHEEHNHHGASTATLARELAWTQDLPTSEVVLIEAGAHLHDIGKIMLPRDLLNAPRKLEPHEITKVRTHTTIGWAILDQAGFEPEIREIVRSHHERFDGNGYPDGLMGEDIPLVARIVAICDVYAALTSRRPYRTAYSPAFAKSFIQTGKGLAFDPQLVDLFFGKVVTDAHG